MSRIRPAWLRKAEVGRGSVQYQGKRYAYTVTPASMADTEEGNVLPLHVGFLNKEHLFISEAIPEAYRPYVLRHEMREFLLLDGQPGRCRASLVLELSEVPWPIYDGYLAFRNRFFSELIAYYAGNPPDFMAELHGSLDYLRELATQPAPPELGGTFRVGKDDLPRLRARVSPDSPEKPERAPQVSPDLVERYRTAAEFFEIAPERVYYPACATDASPSAAFPNAQVAYVDPDEESIEILRKGGFTAHAQRAEEFQPDVPADLLILLNQVVNPSVPLAALRTEGYVFCNDYRGAATTLYQHPGCRLSGVLERTPNGWTVETAELFRYMETVDSEESFKAAPFSFSQEHYGSAASAVKQLMGTTANVYDEYRRLLALAASEGDDHGGLYILRHGRSSVILAGLPRKRGSADHIFIFRKNG